MQTVQPLENAVVLTRKHRDALASAALFCWVPVGIKASAVLQDTLLHSIFRFFV